MQQVELWLVERACTVETTNCLICTDWSCSKVPFSHLSCAWFYPLAPAVFTWLGENHKQNDWIGNCSSLPDLLPLLGLRAIQYVGLHVSLEIMLHYYIREKKYFILRTFNISHGFWFPFHPSPDCAWDKCIYCPNVVSLQELSSTRLTSLWRKMIGYYIKRSIDNICYKYSSSWISPHEPGKATENG